MSASRWLPTVALAILGVAATACADGGRGLEPRLVTLGIWNLGSRPILRLFVTETAAYAGAPNLLEPDLPEARRQRRRTAAR